MKMAVGTMALATFLLVACSGPPGPQGQAGAPGRAGAKIVLWIGNLWPRLTPQLYD